MTICGSSAISSAQCALWLVETRHNYGHCPADDILVRSQASSLSTRALQLSGYFSKYAVIDLRTAVLMAASKGGGDKFFIIQQHFPVRLPCYDF